MSLDGPGNLEHYKHGALRSTRTLAVALPLLCAALYGLGATTLILPLLTVSLLILWPALLFVFSALHAHDQANPLPPSRVLLSSTPDLALKEWSALRESLAEIFLPALGIATILSGPWIIVVWTESSPTTTVGQNALNSVLIFCGLFAVITSINVAMRLVEYAPRLRRALKVDRAIVREQRVHIEDSELEGALHVADLSTTGDISLTADRGAMSARDEVALDLDEQPAEVARGRRS